MKKNLVKFAALGLIAATAAVPAMASAADWRWHEHRENVRDTWKGLAIGSTILGIAGLASGNRDLALVGAAGALYSGYRLDADHRGWDYDRDRRWDYDRDRRWDYRRDYDRDRHWDRDHDHWRR